MTPEGQAATLLSRAAPPGAVPKGHATWILLAGAQLFVAAVVVGARWWFDALQRLWPTSDPTLEGLQFGSFLLVVGFLLVPSWRGDAGLRIGTTVREWRLLALTGSALVAVTAAFVGVTGPNPYSDADPLFELVLVPVGEELVFRGLLLGWLLARLSDRHVPRTAARLAVVLSAITFGSGHASNALFGAGDFALIQVLAAAALGLIFGALRVRTGSLVAPVVLHALVNGVNLLA